MKDSLIEKKIKQYWNPQPPEGMRERLRERVIAKERRTPVLWIRNWNKVLTAACVIIVFFAIISDCARTNRLAELTESHMNAAIASDSGRKMISMRRELAYLMDHKDTWDIFEQESSGDNLPWE